MTYTPAASRYDHPAFFRRCGRWGLKLPALSLGCWHNFGAPGVAGLGDEAAFHENARQMLCAAFDLGITHFDLANNYGPPPGSAEERVGRILREFPRDELILSTKAGYRMGPGPYGEWGSRKYLLASLDQSLRRLGVDYVDIFYHHRPDPDTPLEESMGALDQAVRSGKAIYAGISNYRGAATVDAVRTCANMGLSIPVIHQASYNMFDRWIEPDLLPQIPRLGLGVIAFVPLAQGLLTDRYLQGIPGDSRAGSPTGFLRPQHVTAEKLAKVRKLNDHAKQRGQSLAQMALAWVLRDPAVTSALIGASRPQQIKENTQALQNAAFTADELKAIESILR
jgi:L-glyceraldehyde 3-phosphate reductase